jgi:5-oxoprolinase (ATP-hydrolysing)
VSRWRLFIDTGGTFTDCLAIAPEGDPAARIRRAKVLSSGRLRGTVVDAAAMAPRVHFGGHPLGRDLLRGGLVLAERAAAQGARVLSFDSDSGTLGLDRPLPLRAGGCLEILTEKEPPLLAAHVVTATPLDAPLPPIDLRLATTRGTNALLERRGARTALLTTAGFADVLTIGDQRRPELFALDIRRPPPLPWTVLEVEERIDAAGEVLTPLRPEEIDRLVDALRGGSVEAVAIALLHAWIEPAHEQRLAAALRQRGFQHVVASAERSPTLGFLDRATRATVDAFLGPAIGEYLRRIADALEVRTPRYAPGAGARGSAAPRVDVAARDSPLGPESSPHQQSRIRVLSSAGGLLPIERFAPGDGLLSGPAGGVLGAAAAAKASGFSRAIGLDMGGTSTDVAEAVVPPPLHFRHRVGDVTISAPAVAIETVAAGGGSIVWLDRGHLAVGPSSAGAEPGPACYGMGGPLTLTDVDLLLGRLAADRFEIPIDRQAAERAALALLAAAAAAQRRFSGLEEMLEAAVAIADERMAEAIAAVSIRRGTECRGSVLVAFGGAGGLHACAIAERLGMEQVLLPPNAGLLSAVGLAAAPIERIATRTLLRELPGAATLLAEVAADLAGQLAAEISQELDDRDASGAVASSDGTLATAATLSRGIALLRRRGQESTVDVPFDLEPPPSAAELLARFEARYQALFGHRPPPGAVEIESIRVVASRDSSITLSDLDGGSLQQRSFASAPIQPAPWATGVEELPGASDRGTTAPPTRSVTPAHSHRAWTSGRWQEAPIVRFEELASDQGPRRPLVGPALVAAAHWSAWLPPCWTGSLDGAGALLLRRDGPPTELRRLPAAGTELVANRLQAIAEEMGELLRRTALSVNVKERLDFSCGLLDAQGNLAVNAPHVPVHLGALGPCVRSVMGWFDRCEVLVVNHPAHGGSHLPDVTVITAIRDDSNALLGFAASRAHHAELGGIRPGSMPPFARSLAEEAVVIPPTPLVVDGQAHWAQIESLLRSAPHPSRAVEENLADLAAAVQANAHGAAAVRALAQELAQHALSGSSASAEPCSLGDHLLALRARAARLTREALASRPRGCCGAVDQLDDGTVIAAVVEIHDSPGGVQARVDFTGTAGVHPLSFNATEAIVRSAVLYVLRLLVKEPLPLNEGLLDPIALHLPTGLLRPMFNSDPARSPAVGAGNTETSQRIVDVLLSALGLSAGSQGTMNNVLYGVEHASSAGVAPFGYYETIAGGAGATASGEGASGVHVHMTNTRITDVEVLERRHPVRLERFALRHGSGGRGARRGGDGVVRETRFLHPMRLSVLSQRRVVPPPGAAGGEPGACGRNSLVPVDGPPVDLGPCASLDLKTGDLLRVETPGGGGWGEGSGGGLGAGTTPESPRS